MGKTSSAATTTQKPKPVNGTRYLVDSSTWINLLRGIETNGTLKLRRLLQADAPIFITGCIYQEILQGERNAASYERLKEYFGSLPFCAAPDASTHAEAALIYARLRWAGITIRSANDALIARQALEADLLLLHDDEDFDRIAAIEKGFKLA
ncbi:MAG: PIN domain-containing protein [Pseudomonadota bacterium]